jgi:KDO2-lipid IV(A) lauroyltransferase
MALSGSHKILAQLGFGTVRLIGAIPLSIRRWIGTAIGTILASIQSKDCRIARRQLATFLPEEDTEQLLKGTYRNLARNALEAFNLFPILRHSKFRIHSEPPGLIEQSVKQEQPIVALTAHTGNWDLLAAFMASRDVPLWSIGRPARNPVFHDILDRLRKRYGIRTLWRADATGTREILKTLKSNQVVAALIDQNTEVSSVYVPFFGLEAKTPSGLLALAKRYNARIVTAFLLREPDNSYSVHLKELPQAATIEELLSEYSNQLELLIRQYPEQWVWIHKRWRSRPDHNLKYDEYDAFLQAYSQRDCNLQSEHIDAPLTDPASNHS